MTAKKRAHVRACRWILASLLVLPGCAARTAASALYPEVTARAGRSIESVDFTGTAPFSSDTLRAMVESQPSRCNVLGIPFCIPFSGFGRETHRLDPSSVQRDVQRLSLFYRTEGYFGTRVRPIVENDGDDGVRLTYAVDLGESIVLDALDITGTEGVLDADSLARALPVHPGQIFSLSRFVRAGDMVLNSLRQSGHAYAEILRNYSVDTVDNRAVASIQAIPGPRVVIDSIIVRGAEHLGRTNTIRQLGVRPGDLLRISELARAQSNLYNLELVQIASVAVAPDSMQKPPPGDSSTATVVVTVAEAPVNQADASIGYGTVECIRVDGSLLNRSFGGGARRLALSGSVSKLGLAGRTESGIGKSLCRAFRSDTLIESKIDYRVAVDFTQPYFLSPRNQLSLNLYEERQSEPGIFLREVRGGRTAVSRRLAMRSYATVAYDMERGSTRASPALYCAAFLVCQIGIADSLSRPRIRSAIDITGTHDRTDSPVDPTSGFNATATFTVASAFLGSDIRFLRLTGQGALYQELRPGWVAAYGIRFGNFFRTATLDPTRNFLPPQERFFAGGANSVRGFDRNGLGPGVYVTDAITVDANGDTVPDRFVATGGTALAVGSAELRFPSPVLPDFMRLALFVDAGTIGTRSLWDLGPKDWKVTPGAGLRLLTPVGPVRLDVAYNPYGPTAGPLLLNTGVSDTTSGTLMRVRDSFKPHEGSFFNRFHISLGIGQAY